MNRIDQIAIQAVKLTRSDRTSLPSTFQIEAEGRKVIMSSSPHVGSKATIKFKVQKQESEPSNLEDIITISPTKANWNIVKPVAHNFDKKGTNSNATGYLKRKNPGTSVTAAQHRRYMQFEAWKNHVRTNSEQKKTRFVNELKDLYDQKYNKTRNLGRSEFAETQQPHQIQSQRSIMSRGASRSTFNEGFPQLVDASQKIEFGSLNQLSMPMLSEMMSDLKKVPDNLYVRNVNLPLNNDRITGENTRILNKSLSHGNGFKMIPMGAGDSIQSTNIPVFNIGDPQNKRDIKRRQSTVLKNTTPSVLVSRKKQRLNEVVIEKSQPIAFQIQKPIFKFRNKTVKSITELTEKQEEKEENIPKLDTQFLNKEKYAFNRQRDQVGQWSMPMIPTVNQRSALNVIQQQDESIKAKKDADIIRLNQTSVDEFLKHDFYPNRSISPVEMQHSLQSLRHRQSPPRQRVEDKEPEQLPIEFMRNLGSSASASILRKQREVEKKVELRTTLVPTRSMRRLVLQNKKHLTAANKTMFYGLKEDKPPANSIQMAKNMLRIKLKASQNPIKLI